MDEKLKQILTCYGFSGELVEIKPFGTGHINDTFVAIYREKEKTMRYLLQGINGFVFKDPEKVMQNIRGIIFHMKEKLDAEGGEAEREILNLLPTKDGREYLFDKQGQCWRCFTFIEESFSKDIAETEEDLYEAAKAFGKFQRLLSDYPADTLFDTIPDFHNTGKRYERFLRVVSEDPEGRVEQATAEIMFLKERASEMNCLIELLEQGKLPIRVTHNDTKLNNILMDMKTSKAICVTDLDTVMPGLCLYDFGDAIRFGTNPSAEDERDLSKVYMKETFFEAYTRGFLEEAGKHLTNLEIELLPLGAKIITMECGMRFLTDFLEGDVYFKIHRDGQNLDRARTQLKMVSDMENKWEKMQGIINKYKAAGGK